MELRLSKEQLLNALEGRRKWAEKYDADAKRAHVADEKKALADFKKKLREALKWDYDTAKQNRSRYLYIESLSCPISAVVQLDRAIIQVKNDGRSKYVVRPSGSSGQIFWLLTHDASFEKASLCD